MSFGAAGSLSRRGLLLSAAGSSLTLPPSALSQDPLLWTLCQASAALTQRRISSLELTQLCLERIHKLEPRLNAVITLQEESAIASARASDDRRAGGLATPPLDGIPLALKDNIDTAGVLTTAASNVFRHRVPDEDAEVTRRLKASHAVLLGKLNLDEMAFEGTGTTSCFGPIHNPWNLLHITGGSSAGSAAAVSTGMCFGSVGSDDGGSVRIPGAFCGVVGLKTSYGRVSTRGVVPSAYSMDTIGPIARSVEDAAALLQVLAGFDPRDAIALPAPVPDFTAALHLPIGTLRLGIPRDYFFEQLQPDVSDAVEAAIRLLTPQVREIREVTLPRLRVAENGSYDVELYHFQKPFFDRTPELYHPWSRRQLTELRTVLTVPYVETLKRIRECRRDIYRVFADVDVLLLPTKREPAPLISETVNETHIRPPSNTVAFNHFGTPALTLPCGFSQTGLPIGLQIVGAPFREPMVLSVAYAYQQQTEWRLKQPPVVRDLS